MPTASKNPSGYGAHLPRPVGRAHRRAAFRVRGEVDGFGALAQGEEGRGRDGAREHPAGGRLLDQHHALHLGQVVGHHQHRVGEAEDRAVRADAEAERGDDEQGNAGPAHEIARSESEIAHHAAHASATERAPCHPQARENTTLRGEAASWNWDSPSQGRPMALDPGPPSTLYSQQVINRRRSPPHTSAGACRCSRKWHSRCIR